MIVYHGSVTEVITPDISFPRCNLDFGKGFYVTTIRSQAERWAKRKALRLNGTPVVSIYDFSKTEFDRMKTFDETDSPWLEFVSNSRSGMETEEYDIIGGPVADDDVFKTIDMYFQGIWTKEQVMNSLAFGTPSHQFCFKTQRSIERCLSFLSSYEVQNG